MKRTKHRRPTPNSYENIQNTETRRPSVQTQTKTFSQKTNHRGAKITDPGKKTKRIPINTNQQRKRPTIYAQSPNTCEKTLTANAKRPSSYQKRATSYEKSANPFGKRAYTYENDRT